MLQTTASVSEIRGKYLQVYLPLEVTCDSQFPDIQPGEVTLEVVGDALVITAPDTDVDVTVSSAGDSR